MEYSWIFSRSLFDSTTPNMAKRKGRDDDAGNGRDEGREGKERREKEEGCGVRRKRM